MQNPVLRKRYRVFKWEKKMTQKQAMTIYEENRRKLLAFRYVNFVTEWDHETEAPAGAIPLEATQQGVLAEMEYRLQTDPVFLEAVELLYEDRNQLDSVLAHELEEQHRQIDEMRKIPMEEYTAFREHLAHTYPVYVKAKQQNDFASFAPYLERIITYNRNLTKYLEQPGKTGYDVLLDRFEPGFLKQDYDGFFDLLRRELVPFAAKINASKLEGDFSFGKKTYPREEQIQFCEYLRDVMCVDRNHSVMRESEHPFTTGFGTDDIRITNHYYEDNLPSAIFSAIHESGHGLYMAQVDPTLNDTLSWDGASMAMHESQSRFYENMIGRSPLFWKVHYPKLKETFPEQLRDVPQETFIRYINQSGYSFIRTEADELTYPLHIMLRYEVEKAVVEEGLRAEDIPAFWNERFRDYFGMTPPTDTLGVLQDVHWATGEFGYFPTYALGSAYAAQIYAAMERDLDVEKVLASGTTKEINEWLREHIHRYGASKYPKEILKLATGEEFDPGYYVDYLMHKFTEVYGV